MIAGLAAQVKCAADKKSDLLFQAGAPTRRNANLMQT